MSNANVVKYWTALIIILISGVSVASAQREKNNIYLFDCTYSMKTNRLWEPAKNALHATIATQKAIPGSQFTVIPFEVKPFEPITFDSYGYDARKKAEIDTTLNNIINHHTYTNITAALKEGFSHVDPKKENKIYLLTDGQPDGGDTAEQVAKTIAEWCAYHRNCRLFYVALKNGVVNPVIRDAIAACEDAYVVECKDGVIPQIADIYPDNIYTNLEELSRPMEVAFSLPGNHELEVTCNDTIFDISVTGGHSAGGKIKLVISPKNGRTTESLHQAFQGEDYEFPVTVQSVDKDYFIANPEVTVHVADGIPAGLTLGGGADALLVPEVSWYDSFLWSDAAPDINTIMDLTPVFSNRLNNSRLNLRLVVDNGSENDFTARYNGKPVSNGSILSVSPDEPAILEVQFDHNAKTGKRYFDLVPQEYNSLDMINGQPADRYEGTQLIMEYDVTWNPLKTLLFWIGVIILAALLLWFLLLRRIFFPTIKVAKIEFTGPGSYYASKRIKGARKVVLTARTKSQNILSRIFTGEIRYVRADHFSPEISILPAGRKKKVKVRSEGKSDDMWDIMPAGIFGAYEKGSLIHRSTRQKFEIELS
ncbi:MAG: VWA domain-containing protein [Duncaniella sp.]|nr:VWA domain-containing protein [Duncaniella sp.]